LDGNAKYFTLNNDQPFPIIGKLNLLWTNKPLISDEYNMLEGPKSFLGFPLDASGNTDTSGNVANDIIQVVDPNNPQASYEYANFERGVMYFSPETGTVAIGATESLGTNPLGARILGGTMIIRGSPVERYVSATQSDVWLRVRS
jgi:hypothetical protein